MTSLIGGIDDEIGSIEVGFKPRIDQLTNEENVLVEKEHELSEKLVRLSSNLRVFSADGMVI